MITTVLGYLLGYDCDRKGGEMTSSKSARISKRSAVFVMLGAAIQMRRILLVLMAIGITTTVGCSASRPGTPIATTPATPTLAPPVTATATSTAEQTTPEPPPTITTKGFCGLLTVAEVQAVLGPITQSEEHPLGCRWGEHPRDVGLVLRHHTSPQEAAYQFKLEMQRLEGEETPEGESVGERSFYYTHYDRDGHIVWLQDIYVCELWVNLPDRYTGNRPAALSVARIAAPRIR